MAETSAASISVIPEVTRGTTPNSPMTDLRINSEDLETNTGTVKSQEVSSDRQRGAPARVSVEGAGSISQELSYEALNILLPIAMQNATPTEVDITETTIDFANGDNSINRSAGSFVADGFISGMWIGIKGSAANSVLPVRVDSVVALKMVVSGATLVTEAAGPSVTLNCTHYKNGTTSRYVTLEKRFTDAAAAARYHAFKGMAVDTFGLSGGLGEIVTAEYSFLGNPMEIASASAGDGTFVAAPANDPNNTVDSIQGFLEGLAANTGVTQFGFNLGNGVRTNGAWGILGPKPGAIGVGIGTVDVTGSLSVYFEDEVMINKAIGYVTSSLAVTFRDPAGGRYVVSIPSVKYTKGRVLVAGQNTTVLAEMEFEGFRNTLFNETISVSRIAP